MTLPYNIEIDGREIEFEIEVDYTPGDPGCTRRHAMGGHGDPDRCEAPSGSSARIMRVTTRQADKTLEIPAILWPVLFGPEFEDKMAVLADYDARDSCNDDDHDAAYEAKRDREMEDRA